MAAQRTAQVHWEGELVKGKGEIRNVGSGAFSNLPLTWSARTEASNGVTSPEELLAAAHASCFAMALSATLARNGTPPQTLDVSATCTFDRAGAGWKVASMELNVDGKVPGLDEGKFREIAETAEKGCPVSNALRNNVDIKLNATLS